MQLILQDDFRHAMRRLAASVNIVTCQKSGVWHGMTATAVTSLCLEPPSLLVCVNRTASFHAALCDAEMFCVNILGTQHLDVSNAFGRKVDNPAEKFTTGSWQADRTGSPFLVDAQSNVFCKVASVFSYGTHDIFVGVCESILTADPDTPELPLLYANGRYASPACL
ncbi:flavin reductase family protein [Paraburkholderia antibiotica]|uniref:Flavin reductase n=1 Tax=Paraburkholderia antibiotica TaxID=2728839 RepID=A0A7X9ZZM1_9BURK|nr:flavin reductase family protein [Paraburkholderia antibiotica]NML32948.1 flavin reductase [Paraburkholderia antibiotica]